MADDGGGIQRTGMTPATALPPLDEVSQAMFDDGYFGDETLEDVQRRLAYWSLSHTGAPTSAWCIMHAGDPTPSPPASEGSVSYPSSDDNIAWMFEQSPE